MIGQGAHPSYQSLHLRTKRASLVRSSSAKSSSTTCRICVARGWISICKGATDIQGSQTTTLSKVRVKREMRTNELERLEVPNVPHLVKNTERDVSFNKVRRSSKRDARN